VGGATEFDLDQVEQLSESVGVQVPVGLESNGIGGSTNNSSKSVPSPDLASLGLRTP